MSESAINTIKKAWIGTEDNRFEMKGYRGLWYIQSLQPNIETKGYNIPAAFNKRKNKKSSDSCEKCKCKTGRANHQTWKKSSQVRAVKPAK